jgi:hypothetical protein
MNIEDDSVASDITRVTSNNTKVNDNNNIILDDTEDYEPMVPDNFKEKITKITSWTHEDLAHNTVLGVRAFMTYWNFHSYHWYCYNCNQQLVSTGTDTWECECPTCKFWRYLRATMMHIGILESVNAATI